jgi:superfamily II DNA or RNA helicase
MRVKIFIGKIVAHLWQHAIATIDSHWEDQTEFTLCTSDTIKDFRKALTWESSGSVTQGQGNYTFFDLQPYGFQKIILDDIAAERTNGKNRHLIISATGIGKTMVVAFDYQNYAKKHNGQPRLLFVAHREEILKQAQAAFRQVLRDGNFGELLFGGNDPDSYDHLFCTVQSWNSRKLNQFAPDHFDMIPFRFTSFLIVFGSIPEILEKHCHIQWIIDNIIFHMCIVITENYR